MLRAKPHLVLLLTTALCGAAEVRLTVDWAGVGDGAGVGVRVREKEIAAEDAYMKLSQSISGRVWDAETKSPVAGTSPTR